jgi:hypothetical protein
VDCERCGKRKHSFFEYPVGDLFSYLCEPRPWASKVVAIAHNASGFDMQFLLNRAMVLKWQPEVIMNGLKIISMKIQHIHFIDSLLFLPMPLRKLPGAFGLTATKAWYTHFYNTKENTDYVGPIPDVQYFGVDTMSNSERNEFLAWYERQKHCNVWNNKRVLEEYCQSDVTVLRQACHIFRRDFIQIGNVDVFLESVTIASACNSVEKVVFEARYYRSNTDRRVHFL